MPLVTYPATHIRARISDLPFNGGVLKREVVLAGQQHAQDTVFADVLLLRLQVVVKTYLDGGNDALGASAAALGFPDKTVELKADNWTLVDESGAIVAPIDHTLDEAGLQQFFDSFPQKVWRQLNWFNWQRDAKQLDYRGMVLLYIAIGDAVGKFN